MAINILARSRLALSPFSRYSSLKHYSRLPRVFDLSQPLHKYIIAQARLPLQTRCHILLVTNTWPHKFVNETMALEHHVLSLPGNKNPSIVIEETCVNTKFSSPRFSRARFELIRYLQLPTFSRPSGLLLAKFYNSQHCLSRYENIRRTNTMSCRVVATNYACCIPIRNRIVQADIGTLRICDLC